MDCEFSKLGEKLKKDISVVAKDYVEPLLKDITYESIQRYVYDVYTPKVYKRRADSNAFGSITSLKTETKGTYTTVVKVENIARGKNGRHKRLDAIIETGVGYDFNFSMPRPWALRTEQRLLKSGEHLKALEKGLKSKGYK